MNKWGLWAQPGREGFPGPTEDRGSPRTLHLQLPTAGPRIFPRGLMLSSPLDTPLLPQTLGVWSQTISPPPCPTASRVRSSEFDVREPQSSHQGIGGGELSSCGTLTTFTLTVCFCSPLALPQAPLCPPGSCREGLPASPPTVAPLGSLPEACGSWNLERSLACARCLPPAGAPPLTCGQEFLPLAPKKPAGKEELWEEAGNRVEVRTELGGTLVWGRPKQGRLMGGRRRMGSGF